jgi:hypothetical protein
MAAITPDQYKKLMAIGGGGKKDPMADVLDLYEKYKGFKTTMSKLYDVLESPAHVDIRGFRSI